MGIRRFERSIDSFLFVPVVNAGADVAIHRIGLIEVAGQVVNETEVFAGDGREPLVQINAFHGPDRAWIRLIADRHGVVAHAIEPIHDVLAAIAAGRSRCSTHTEVNGTTGQVEVFSDLLSSLLTPPILNNCFHFCFVIFCSYDLFCDASCNDFLVFLLLL